MTFQAPLLGLLRCRKGAMAIEAALVAPVLLVLSIGTFEAGMMVSRQQELQSAASEAEGIILAAAATPGGATSDDIQQIIEHSLKLDSDQIELSQRFRCNTESELLLDGTGCDATKPIYRYVHLVLTDTYTPTWANFGVGSPFDYNVERTILVR
jgi:Flp pilus assembly protein TadG